MDVMSSDIAGKQTAGKSLSALSVDQEPSNLSSPVTGLDPNAYLEGLIREKEALASGSGMELTKRLLMQEIERVQNGSKYNNRFEERKMADVTKDKAIKLTVKVLVPVRDHPKFNFVGKLLGPKGNSLKRLQEETMTKMAILGKGSMRDKQKEEELRMSGDPKFNHLSEDLHVEVTAVAPPAEAHARIAFALTEIRRYLVPDYNDDIRQEQMREMQLLNNATSNGSSVASNNGAVNGSEEGSFSPHSNEEEKSVKKPTTSCLTKGLASLTGSITGPHPALRGLNRTQAAFIAAGKDSGGPPKGRGVGATGKRRSVLSLLTTARALQQKEQELIGVYPEIQGYSLFDHLRELPVADSLAESITGRAAGPLKVTTSPVDRSRFRHDPYPRIPSST